MTPGQWKRLMDDARAHANFYQEKASVVGVKLKSTTVRHVMQSGWWYVIDCPKDCPCRAMKQVLRDKAARGKL